MDVDKDILEMIEDGVPYWFKETSQWDQRISGKLMVDTGIAPLQKLRNVYVFDYKNGAVTGVRLVQF